MTVINDEELLYSADELQFRQHVRDFLETEIMPLQNDSVCQQLQNPRINWKRVA